MPNFRVSTTTEPGTWIGTCGTTEINIRARTVTIGASTPTGRRRVEDMAAAVETALSSISRRFTVITRPGGRRYRILGKRLTLDDAEIIGGAARSACRG